jgi:beta-lactamase class D
MRKTAFVLATLIAAVGFDAGAQTRDIARHFEGITGTFVLLNGRTGEYTRYNPARAAQQFSPCSTYKIPNTLIALETGVAPDPEYLLKYDPALKLEGQGPNGSWGRDNTLQSAFANSVVWYYQEMARRVGAARMQRFVKQFGYGNQDISGGIDKFWLASSLVISPDEQVQFLKRYVEGRLGLSDRTVKLGKDIMRVEETPRWRLSAKTGACQAPGQEAAMWYVGWVEKGADTYYFALEMGDSKYGELLNQRIPKARAILTDLGVLD